MTPPKLLSHTFWQPREKQHYARHLYQAETRPSSHQDYPLKTEETAPNQRLGVVQTVSHNAFGDSYGEITDKEKVDHNVSFVPSKEPQQIGRASCRERV